jgi:flagellin
MSRVASARAVDTRLNHMMRRQSEAIGRVRERLSSGSKINRAADDAAGLAISVTLNHRTEAFGQARTNASEAISFLQTKDAFMGTLIGLFDRMRELTVRASNETIDDDMRAVMAQELSEIKNTFDDTLEQTYNTHRLFSQFVGIVPLPGTQDMTFQVGIDAGKFVSGSTITLEGDTIKQIWAQNKNRIQVITQAKAQASMKRVDKVLSRVSLARSVVGAVQVRMEVAVGNIETIVENGVASEARIRDADFAEETSRLTRADIILNSSLALSTQVNAVRRGVLRLLQ